MWTHKRMDSGLKEVQYTLQITRVSADTWHWNRTLGDKMPSSVMVWPCSTRSATWISETGPAKGQLLSSTSESQRLEKRTTSGLFQDRITQRRALGLLHLHHLAVIALCRSWRQTSVSPAFREAPKKQVAGRIQISNIHHLLVPKVSKSREVFVHKPSRTELMADRHRSTPQGGLNQCQSLKLAQGSKRGAKYCPQTCAVVGFV